MGDRRRIRAWKSGSNRTFMELKWNNTEAYVDIIMRSNRTFMELKLLGTYKVTQCFLVLIVPLWN